jgi:hypothetical protein
LSTPPWGVLAILVIYNPSTVERREQRGRESAGSATGGIERGWREREFRVRASNFGRNRLLEGPDIYIRICRVAFPRVPNYFRYDAGNLTDRSKECELGRQQGPGNGLHPGHYKGREVPYRNWNSRPIPEFVTPVPVGCVKTRCPVASLTYIGWLHKQRTLSLSSPCLLPPAGTSRSLPEIYSCSTGDQSELGPADKVERHYSMSLMPLMPLDGTPKAKT